MNYVAQEVLRILKILEKQVNSFDPVKPKDSKVISRGLQVSKSACQQEEYVHPTPIMKNAMIIYGDVKQTQINGEWHTEKFPAKGELGKAASTLLEILHAAMLKEFGAETHEYNRNVPFTDPSFYHVDCWNFYHEIKDDGKFWDIQPKQLEQLRERIKVYTNPKTNLSISEMISLIEKHPEIQKALEIESRIWPITRASRDITAISDPFMSKKTGVSYPDYANDSTTVPGTNMTYGAYEIKLAREAYERGGLSGAIEFAIQWSVYTVYTRRQLGKGRFLGAESRRSNLIINMVNGVEMENVKKTKALQIPFLDEEDTLSELSKLSELALKNGLWPVNIDASSWDQNLGVGILVLQNAFRHMLGQGEFTKRLIETRNLLNTKAYLMDGTNNKVSKVYGRMFSGYDDTTLGNSCANRLTATSSAIMTDKHYVDKVISKMDGYHVITVGDDLLIVLDDPSKAKDFIKAETETFKFVIHGDEKYAEGVFFIQWRVFKFEGRYVMAYNVPRVFRSMLSKEDAKHLGRFGWTCAYYQQLGKLVRYKPALKIVVNILAAFDQYHLSLDLPVSQIIKGVQEEDQAATLNGKKHRIQSTAERMYRSNPNIAGLIEKDGVVELDDNYFDKIQKECKSVYDPEYLLKLGFPNPDISKIH